MPATRSSDRIAEKLRARIHRLPPAEVSSLPLTVERQPDELRCRDRPVDSRHIRLVIAKCYQLHSRGKFPAVLQFCDDPTLKVSKSGRGSDVDRAAALGGLAFAQFINRTSKRAASVHISLKWRVSCGRRALRSRRAPHRAYGICSPSSCGGPSNRAGCSSGDVCNPIS